jgi:hypothetical protein
MELQRAFQVPPEKTASLPSCKDLLLSLQVMKLILALTLALASLAGAFDIPKGSYNLAQLEEARKKAAEAKQPIAFLITEKEGIAT